MTNFHGFCSYPHGGLAVLGLTLTCAAALAVSMYAFASCRFLKVDFDSDRGGFAEFYLDPTSDGDVVRYRAGIGLYTWLKPFDEEDWSQGQCTGYTALQRETFGDIVFEVSRIFGVFSVLGGIGVTAWTFFLGCLSLGRCQIWSMSLLLFLITGSTGLTFLMSISPVCQSLTAGLDDSFTSKCSLDQGGLMTIGGTLLWGVAFLICLVYIKSPEADLVFTEDGQIINAFEERQRQKQLWCQRQDSEEEDSLPPIVATTYGEPEDFRVGQHRARGNYNAEV